MTKAEQSKLWRLRHPDKVKAWREKNREHQKVLVKGWRDKMGLAGFKAYRRAYYLKNSAAILASNKRSRLKNDPEGKRHKAYQVAYWEKHGNRIRAHRRKRFALIPKIRAQIQEWKKANPERVKILRNKGNGIRRARERAATIGDLTDIAKIYERCAWWRQWFDASVDHIISLAKGGTHEASNLQIIYRSENSKKHTNPDYKPKVVFV